MSEDLFQVQYFLIFPIGERVFQPIKSAEIGITCKDTEGHN